MTIEVLATQSKLNIPYPQVFEVIPVLFMNNDENYKIIILTDKILELGRSSNGGYSQKQLELLGIQGFPKGWKRNIVGQAFPLTTIIRFVDLKDRHLSAHPPSLSLSLQSSISNPDRDINDDFPILDSLCVNSSSIENSGLVDYRGVLLKTGEVLFKKKPMQNCTNIIGEFLSIVHGLAYLNERQLYLPIYSNNSIAIKWVRQKQIRTNIEWSECNKEVFYLVARAKIWLEEHNYQNKIIQWKTREWGRIPVNYRSRTSRSN